MIVILQHESIEGPGMFSSVFEQGGLDLRLVRLYGDDPLPDDYGNIEGVLALGGPMNVYEEERYPFLKNEDEFLRGALRRGIPVMGVCLGAQMLAKACGAAVKKAPQKEIGWHRIKLTQDGTADALFKGICPEFDVFQWHEDTFEIPNGGVRLAGSRLCPNQAFRIGENAYGLQFHVEVTDKEIGDWTKEYLNGGEEQNRLAGEEMLRVYERIKRDFKQRMRMIGGNFLNMMRKAGTQG